MAKKRNSGQPLADAAALRKRTMEQPSLSAQTPEEIQRVFHELQVYQMELEMQNEELRTAQEAIEAGRDRYYDLYDLAPVGYCTLSEKGLILEANLTVATLLGTARGTLVKQPISRFIIKEDQDIYYLHRKQLFETSKPQEWELRLVKPDGAFIWAHLTATADQAEDGAPVCRVVISDITVRKQAQEQLKERVKELNCLYTISSIVKEPDIDLENILQKTANIVPDAMRYPEIAVCRTNLDGKEYLSEGYKSSRWVQASDLHVNDQKVGFLEVHYVEDRSGADESPFLKEEKELINEVAERLGRKIEQKRAEEALYRERTFLSTVLNTIEEAHHRRGHRNL